tara:strand:- start:21 stop:269 length:249 start_codon:yes stop_codon:yes gene_type:complete
VTHWNVRRLIRGAASAGWRPHEVRAMIPRDWLLVVAGYSDQAKAAKGPRPGEKAPGTDRARELFALLRERRALAGQGGLNDK